MANNSAIEWTDTTWNPLAGCTWASAGCDHCYAAVMARRLEAMALADIAARRDPGQKRKYIGITHKNTAGRVMFNGKVNLDMGALSEPLHWKKPRRVFVNSMSDLFHKDVPYWFINWVFLTMRNTPQHTYQVLTKRPDLMAAWSEAYGDWPSNVWAGTSVENQEQADIRIPHLRHVPAAVRFLSCEPMLGPLDELDLTDIHWVIVGGESGHGARPMHPAWVRSLRDQCIAAAVPFFFKQWGEWAPVHDLRCTEPGIAGRQWHTFDPDSSVCRLGKHAAGRLLDGRVWNDMPAGIEVTP